MSAITVSRKNQTIIKKVISDVTISTNVNADVTGMSFPIGASETWSVEFHLQIGCNNTGGVNFAMQIPASASHRTVVVGMGGTSTAVASTVLTSTVSSSNLNTVNSANGWARLTAVIVNSTTAGTVQLRFKSGTDTQTSTVFADSYLVARRITP
jgi:hypothetical protein